MSIENFEAVILEEMVQAGAERAAIANLLIQTLSIISGAPIEEIQQEFARMQVNAEDDERSRISTNLLLRQRIVDENWRDELSRQAQVIERLTGQQ